MGETGGSTLPRHIDGNASLVPLVKIRHCHDFIAKYSFLKWLKPRKLVPTASFRITWLPGIPTSPSLSTRTDHGTSPCQYECDLSPYALIHLQCPCTSLQGCGAVKPLTVTGRLSYHSIIMFFFFFLWPASVADTVKNQRGLRYDRLDWMLKRCHECFLKMGRRHISRCCSLSSSACTCLLSRHAGSPSRGWLVALIDTVIFPRF